MSKPRLTNVCPRYTCGSPAAVDADTARQVMHQEAEAFNAAVAGYHGEEIQKIAKRLGLQRIVYSLSEKRGKWHTLQDWLTNEVIEGHKEIELELAALGTRQIPRKKEKVLNDWGLMPQFNAMDFVDRRDVLRNCEVPGWMLENQKRLYST